MAIRKNFSDPIEEALQGRTANQPKKVVPDQKTSAPDAPAASKTVTAQDDTKKATPAAAAQDKAPKKTTPRKTDKAAGSTEAAAPAKKSVGRPRVEDALKKQYKISVMLSSDINEMLQQYKPALGGSVSAYVEALIRADMDKNEATYKQISDMLKKTHK